jgi:hypothetical protein
LVTGLAAFGAALVAAFEAVAFEPAAFAEVFAVLLGIALLLFFEDLPAEALVAVRPPLREVRARLLVAPRLAAAAFFALLETLFLRVFCDTACARNRRAPVRVSREPLGAIKAGTTGSDRLNVPIIAHFPQNSMVYARFRPARGR